MGPIEDLGLYASASYNHSEVKANIPLNIGGTTHFLPTAGKRLVETPDWTYSARAQYQIAGFQFGLQGKYTGRRFTTDINDDTTPSYTTVDANVRYPGLPSDPAHAVAARQMRYFGPVVSFELASAEIANKFLSACRLITEATSFGGLHTTAERRARWGGDKVPGGFIRLSAGCEHPDDLLADIAEELENGCGIMKLRGFPVDKYDEDDLPEESGGLPLSAKNYMTPGGFARLREELDALMRKERPEVVKVVTWAASNGDRSENGDYIYGKKRLREIDRRVRYLSKRLANAEVVDPAKRAKTLQVFFGATVTTANARDVERTVKIVGVDEVDLSKGHVSWISPIAKALLRAEQGDVVKLRTPAGVEELEIVKVEYL